MVLILETINLKPAQKSLYFHYQILTTKNFSFNYIKIFLMVTLFGNAKKSARDIFFLKLRYLELLREIKGLLLLLLFRVAKASNSISKRVLINLAFGLETKITEHIWTSLAPSSGERKTSSL